MFFIIFKLKYNDIYDRRRKEKNIKEYMKT
jgi:hypothetical protein